MAWSPVPEHKDQAMDKEDSLRLAVLVEAYPVGTWHMVVG
jgi:hypothetical protein